MMAGGGTRKAERGFDRLGTAAIQMCAIESGGRHLGERLEGCSAFFGGEGADSQSRRLV